jgi:hypothetical protein
LDVVDVIHHSVKSGCQQMVDGGRIIGFDKVWFVAIAQHQALELFVINSCEHCWAGDFVPIQMKDGENRTVTRRVKKLGAMPGCGQWACFGFSITDHTGNDEIRPVEGSAERMGQAITEFSSFMERPGRFRRAMATDAARE